MNQILKIAELFNAVLDREMGKAEEDGLSQSPSTGRELLASTCVTSTFRNTLVMWTAR